MGMLILFIYNTSVNYSKHVCGQIVMVYKALRLIPGLLHLLHNVCYHTLLTIKFGFLKIIQRPNE